MLARIPDDAVVSGRVRALQIMRDYVAIPTEHTRFRLQRYATPRKDEERECNRINRLLHGCESGRALAALPTRALAVCRSFRRIVIYVRLNLDCPDCINPSNRLSGDSHDEK
jgi:hypothetical protein